MLPFQRNTQLYHDPEALHYRLVISYEGTFFWGWQAHSSLPTIELALHGALSKFHHHPTCLLAASRTDAGVHAAGQCVKLSTTHKLPKGALDTLNNLLPLSIAVHCLESSTHSFHPSLDVKEKSYHYKIGLQKNPLKRLTQWFPPFSAEVMSRLRETDTLKKELEEPIKKLVMTEDFSALTNRLPDGKISSPKRKLHRIEIVADEKELTFIVQGESFSYKMVRNIVGSLVACATGKLCPKQFVIALEKGDRTKMGPTAPAKGLTLSHIDYKNN